MDPVWIGERMRSCPTQQAKIELGLAPGCRDAVLDEIDLAAAQLGLCVSLTPTRYVCPAGSEDGLVVGLLSVPGMPVFSREAALGLARRLLGSAGQHTASVVFPDETVLVTEDDDWPS